MRRVISAVVALPELIEARHIGRHVTVGRNDDRRRPAHDMVSGEERAPIGVAKVIGCVAWCRHRDERLAVDLDLPVILEHLVR